MCGIAGIIQTHGPFYSREQLEKMMTALAHRGPEGSGSWENNNREVLFGHRRLSIIDLTEKGEQPLHYLDRYTIIHNGEIYNYIELKEDLQKDGYTFRSATDTEVIAAAFDKWRGECVDRFDGMFAFAVWDEKEKSFFAARDRFGEKPFYYSFEKEVLVFASEMKALWAAGVPRVPNQKMLFNFITIGYTDNPLEPGETFFENIFQLPPATTLTYTTNTRELILEKYWDLDPEFENRNITEEEAIEEFTNLFTTSVKRRLRSDVPVGTSLSGGLDSSSVAATINQLQILHYQPHGFTASFPGYEKDESGPAGVIARKFNMQQFMVTPSAEDLLNQWAHLCHHQEEPFGSASVYAQYKVFEMAKQQNIKVLLDGQGADEILAGYTRYFKWYWQELFRKRKLRRSGELVAAREAGIKESFGFKNMIASYFPDFATIVIEQQYLVKATGHEDLTKEFVRLQSKEAYYTAPSYFTLNGALYFNTITHGLGELLRYADRNAMAHGCEVRLPFLSHDLVEFVFSLPATFKIRKGRTKWLLRESMKDRLPSSIINRTDKVGFEPPQKSWMENEAVKDAIYEAKKMLVAQRVLKESVLNRQIIPHSAHAPEPFDWRYLSAAFLFK